VALVQRQQIEGAVALGQDDQGCVSQPDLEIAAIDDDLRGSGDYSPYDPSGMVTAMMDRRRWLAARRAAVEAEYDTDAPGYDDHPYPATSHTSFVERLLDRCPPGGAILDAPCGTGRYFALVRASGRTVVGVDQSAGMLAQASAKGIATRLERIGLQEMAFDGEFDGAMTIDAMENVPPEDWPVVLANLHRAIRPAGHCYLTVEEIAESDIDEAFAAAKLAGLPAVRGEVIEGDVAGYHYYPGRERVLEWLTIAGFEIVAERFDQEDGWGYRHLLLRGRPMPGQ
jgi:SAM-dependent methyltransferase